MSGPAPVVIPSYDIPIYVLGTDRKLWVETGPFKVNGPVPPGRTLVDANVQNFEVMDANNVYVLGTDGSLWLETKPFGRVLPPIAGNVVEFDRLAFNGLPLSYESKRVIYVLDGEGNLWLERFQANPPLRTQVDRNVLAFAAVDENNVFVLGTDRNLWLEKTPFGTVPQPQRIHIDGNVKGCQAIPGSDVFILGTDNKLWRERTPF